MDTRRLAFGTGFVVAAVVLGGCGGGGDGDGANAPVQIVSDEGIGIDRPALTAAGTGRASAAPDTLVVALAIHTEGATAAETLDVNNLRTQQLLDTARSQGVADADLQTMSVNLYPRFNQFGTRVIGFTADNSFTVRYRDLETAGGLLDGLVGVGADAVRVLGLTLEIDDPTDLLAEARADAVERAAAQAEQLAQSAGVELGDIRTITEVRPASSREFDEALEFGRFAGDVATSVPIEGGSQEMTVQVEVVYDIAGGTR
jgi:uncharacterized protein YggE